jgi:hypothetical protein
MDRRQPPPARFKSRLGWLARLLCPPLIPVLTAVPPRGVMLFLLDGGLGVDDDLTWARSGVNYQMTPAPVRRCSISTSPMTCAEIFSTMTRSWFS